MDWVSIGKVVSVNFPRRELRLVPVTEHLERFDGLDRLHLLRQDGTKVDLDVSGVRRAGGKVCILLSDTEPTELLGTLRGAAAVVDEDERYMLPDDEYYHDELIGLNVVDSAGWSLGRVTGIYPFGHHDVYEITGDGGTEYLVAAVRTAILEIDVAGGRIVVEPAELVSQDSHAG